MYASGVANLVHNLLTPAFVLLTGASALAEKSQVTPIQKVLTLMEELKAKGIKEKNDEVTSSTECIDKASGCLQKSWKLEATFSFYLMQSVGLTWGVRAKGSSRDGSSGKMKTGKLLLKAG